jgi:hypothetical protein
MISIGPQSLWLVNQSDRGYFVTGVSNIVVYKTTFLARGPLRNFAVYARFESIELK